MSTPVCDMTKLVIAVVSTARALYFREDAWTGLRYGESIAVIYRVPDEKLDDFMAVLPGGKPTIQTLLRLGITHDLYMYVDKFFACEYSRRFYGEEEQVLYGFRLQGVNPGDWREDWEEHL